MDFATFNGAGLSRVAGALLTVGILASLWMILSFSIFADGLTPQSLPTIIPTVVSVGASVTGYALMHRRKTRIWRRFEQQLAPALVRRILAKPTALKLIGERREVTALFTDLEGFSAMTRRADPTALVSTLDNYFEGIATIIVAHGGIIDKIVGDAVHALFNAVTDLEDHPRKAIECAVALRSWAETFRHRPEVATIGFGRTRIGIESGPAIVGDIGIHATLDYTAYGDAVNVAARLERANKELGSSICIGPVAASRCDKFFLRPLGKINIHGRDDDIAVFEPRHFSLPLVWETSNGLLASQGLRP
jgi:adenylate cyclase